MHSAPSVTFPVGRSRDAGRLLGVIWAAGACCAGAVSYQFDSIGWRTGVLLTCSALSAVLALRAYRGQPTGELRFDGQGWSFWGASVGGVQAARLLLALDLQSLLLVRLTLPGQPSCWLWLAQRSAPQRWPDLRRAVYSRAPTADPADSAAASGRSSGDSPSLP
jgi:toxin CptA